MNWWLVAIGGVAGTLSRYWLGGVISDRWPVAFPLGTFAVNLTGSVLLGLVAGLSADRGLLPPQARLALGIGFCGAYTTFSTWSLETLRLMEAGSWGLAALNVAGSTVAGLAGAWLGLVLARAI